MRFSLIKKKKAFQKNYMMVGLINYYYRSWCQQGRGEFMQVEMALTKRLKLRRQMWQQATRAQLLCPWFMEAFGIEVEEELSIVATHYWAEKSGTENGTMNREKLR